MGTSPAHAIQPNPKRFFRTSRRSKRGTRGPRENARTIALFPGKKAWHPKSTGAGKTQPIPVARRATAPTVFHLSRLPFLFVKKSLMVQFYHIVASEVMFGGRSNGHGGNAGCAACALNPRGCRSQSAVQRSVIPASASAVQVLYVSTLDRAQMHLRKRWADFISVGWQDKCRIWGLGRFGHIATWTVTCGSESGSHRA